MIKEKISRFNDGTVYRREFWLVDGNGNYTLHNPYGPSFELFWADNILQSQSYHNNGQLHRVDGPAILNYKTNGELRHYEWFIKDTNISEEVNAWMAENNISWPFTKEQTILFKLRFA